MTILFVPSLECNLRCKYCFAEGYSWVKPIKYDVDAMLEKADTLFSESRNKSQNLCVHGGECTIVDKSVLEKLLKKAFDLTNNSAIQSNAYAIDDELINLFLKYKTHIGVSIDGDGELNSLRGFPNNPEKTKAYTDKVIENMLYMKSKGVSVGLITVLSKANADSKEKLDKLFNFILRFHKQGISGGRLNPMWSRFEANKKYELTAEELEFAWLYLYGKFKEHNGLNWQPYREFVDNLLGYGHSSCSMGKCDYFCTTTRVITADGSMGNCDRTHQDKTIVLREEEKISMVRYDILRNNDCKNCRFWDVCYGGCPSEGVDNDWRNKTRFCKAIYSLYSAIEFDLKNLLPNLILMSEYKDNVDYFDVMHQGSVHDAFEKMSWITNKRPSSWQYPVPREDVIKKC